MIEIIKTETGYVIEGPISKAANNTIDGTIALFEFLYENPYILYFCLVCLGIIATIMIINLFKRR